MGGESSWRIPRRPTTTFPKFLRSRSGGGRWRAVAGGSQRHLSSRPVNAAIAPLPNEKIIQKMAEMAFQEPNKATTSIFHLSTDCCCCCCCCWIGLILTLHEICSSVAKFLKIGFLELAGYRFRCGFIRGDVGRGRRGGGEDPSHTPAPSHPSYNSKNCRQGSQSISHIAIDYSIR